MTTGHYRVIGGSHHWVGAGRAPIKLCNFTGAITSATMLMGSVRSGVYLELVGTLEDGTPLPLVEMPARALVGDWWCVAWGSRPAVAPGIGVARLIDAIKAYSPKWSAVIAHMEALDRDQREYRRQACK